VCRQKRDELMRHGKIFNWRISVELAGPVLQRLSSRGSSSAIFRKSQRGASGPSCYWLFFIAPGARLAAGALTRAGGAEHVGAGDG
jgi:hypothetical protein